jgi:hypothetical protein
LLPHEATGTTLLAKRHEYLTRFYLDLMADVLGVRRMSGGMVIGGFEAGVAFIDAEPGMRCP